METTEQSTPRWLRRYTKFVAAGTLFLIYAGAMVTSTGSGLAVPDWPLSYGMVFPPMVGGIFYEHGHRMIAATIGLLTVIQAFLLWKAEPKRFVRALGWVAVGAVIAQGLLGGLTVLLFLPPAISIAHAGLAEIFLCINLSIAFFTSVGFGRLRAHARFDSTAPAITLLPFFVFGQILLGALMRHLGAGLAIPDFPLAFGRLIPDLSTLPVAANFAHRLGALIVLIVIGFAVRAAFRRDEAVRRTAAAVLAIVVLQITLGALTVWTGKAPVITSLHVVTGALLLASSLLMLLADRATNRGRTPLGVGVGTEVTA